MTENEDNRGERLGSRWVELIAMGLAFLGAIVCVGGSVAIYSSQAPIPGVSLWPLPGMVLILWALLGLLCVFAVYINLRRASTWWLQALIFLSGTFIPLIIIGAFSIGTLVMIGFLFLLISMLILAVRSRAKFLESFGLFMLGAIANLALLYLIITLANTGA